MKALRLYTHTHTSSSYRKEKSLKSKEKLNKLGTKNVSGNMPYVSRRTATAGITLIALVVTIVVLLILAGITIQVVLQGGIIGQANKASESYKIADLKDRIDVIRMAWIADKAVNPSLPITDLWDRLIAADIIATVDDVEGPEKDTDGNDVYLLNTKDGYTVEIIVNDKGHVNIGDIVKGTLAPVIRRLETKTTKTSISVKAVVSRLKTGTVTYSYKLKTASGDYTKIDVGEDGWHTVASGITENAVYEVKVIAQNDVGKDEKTFDVTAKDHKVENIILNKETAEIGIGEELTLIATVEPEDAENKEITWSSNRTSVATVDQNGKVTGVAKGTATITATAKDGSGVTGTCTVTVVRKESNWEEIANWAKQIAQSGIESSSETAEVNLSTGGTKTITIGDKFYLKYGSNVLEVRVLGFNHDTLANGVTYKNDDGTSIAGITTAGISFEFTEFLGSTHVMNSSGGCTNGWGGNPVGTNVSKMRTYLNGSNTSIGGEAAKLTSIQPYIKKVSKPYAICGETTATRNSDDWLWLLSASEIWNKGVNSSTSYGHSKSLEGTRYAFYAKNVSETGANGILVKKTTSGSANSWWLRSPHYANSSDFCRVSIDGSAGHSSASDSYSVAPGFCI